METRRGKYWKPDPERLKKAEEKRERKRLVNIKRDRGRSFVFVD